MPNIPSDLIIKYGSHKSLSDGACLLELASHLAREPWSDHPQCVCPVIAAIGRRLNDSIGNDAMRTELLKPLLPKLLNTRGSRALELRRAFACADAAVRIFTPSALEHRGQLEWAKRLRELPAIVDAASARSARDEARAAAAAAYAAAYAYAAADAYAAAAYAAASADAAANAAAADAAAARKAEYQKCVTLIEQLCNMKE